MKESGVDAHRLQSLAIVVPCFNEADSLVELVDRVELAIRSTHLANWEIVLIDDGSSDNTADVARCLAEERPRVTALLFSRNFGKESAMFAGLEHVGDRHDGLVFLDGDLQHPPEFIPELISHFEPDVHQVVAIRNRAAQGGVRRVFTRAYYKVSERLTDIPLTAGAGDFRLISRQVVAALLELPERTRYSKGLFTWVGFKEVHVHYTEDERSHGTSGWSTRSLLDYSGDALTSFNSKPLRLGFTVGVASIVLSLAYLTFELIVTITGGRTTPGYFTLMGAVLFFGGTQLLFLGVLGQYVGRIYEEVKARPHYVVASRHARVAPLGHDEVGQPSPPASTVDNGGADGT